MIKKRVGGLCFLLLAMIISHGCLEDDGLCREPLDKSGELVFKASIDGNLATKTTYDAENHLICWKREDMAGVIAGYGAGYFSDVRMQPFSINDKNQKGDVYLSSATFSGKLTDKGEQTYTYYAIYPYTAFQAVDDVSAVSSRLEERQFPDLKSWDGACDMLVSRPLTVSSPTVAAEGLELQFTRLFGMLRLRFGSSILDTYGSEIVETISIESADPTDVLAGKFTADLSSDEAPDPVMSTVPGEYYSKVILDYRCKNATLGEIDAYFVLNAGLYQSVTITIKTNGHILTLPRTSLLVNRGCISSATLNWKGCDSEEESLPLLPKNPETLKVFTFGNSFVNNSMQFINNLLNSAGIENVTFAHFYIGGCSLKTHWEHTQNPGNSIGGSDKITYYKRYYNGKQMVTSSGSKTVIEALRDEPWDVVVLQTVSTQVGFYDKYAPYLNLMIDYVKSTCQAENSKVPVIAWHMCWAFGTHSSKLNQYYENSQILNYQANVNSTKNVLRDSEIQIVIPTGTAIQSLRHSSLNNQYSGSGSPYEFTDASGWHMDERAGCYTCACTWFESFMKPCFGISVLGNPCVLSEIDKGVQVTEENREFIQRAAVLACKYPFEISHLDEIFPEEDTPHEGDESGLNVTGSCEKFGKSQTYDQSESFTLIDNLTW